MPAPDEILRSATHVVVKDYSSRDVPDALRSAGLAVTIYAGLAYVDDPAIAEVAARVKR